jgi:hypothetical protein
MSVVLDTQRPPSPSPSSPSPAVVSTGPTRAGVSSVRVVPGSTTSRCGRALPVDVVVQGGIGKIPDTAVPGPVAGRGATPLSPGQVAVHWVGPTDTLELRWPPDPRPLYGGDENARYGGVDPSTSSPFGGAEAADGRLSLGSGLTRNGVGVLVPLLTLSQRPEAPAHPVRPCDLLQVRMIAKDGSSETIGVWPTSTDSYDLGPLIGRRESLRGPFAPTAAVECPDVVMSPTSVTASVIGATPAEALRAYLAGPLGTAAMIATPARPFREFHITEDRSYRYERFTNWNEHQAVTVTHLTGGWAVTSWNTGAC